MKRLRTTVTIEYDNPYPDDDVDGYGWLCKENIGLALRKQLPNSNVKVTLFYQKLRKCDYNG